ncbi:ankyrin repeat-containing domain protein [Lasiosphaeris hirsuta]|uniref:Ankyrin repeat-containing domain protein n=1 Tax=Lasiosphaeris hirsuta TaxID=260670 RepID=A0AA40AHN0_9PEZI|nr:ankyrin repeat-containing domain protein [Lasiosphaeris hirsuta]
MGGRKPSDSINWLIRAAKLGLKIAQVVVYRASTSLGLFEERQDEILPFLKQSAEDGFITALDELSAIDETASQDILERLLARRREQYLGSPFLGSDSSQWADGPDRAGDDGSLLRSAARCGHLPLVKKLLELRGDDLSYLNSQGADGQTALLEACMAGDSPTVTLLLSRGADASIPDHGGDTPLHWLFFFDDNPSIKDLAARLVQGHGNVHAQTSKEWWHSTSFKELASGTPLHRAAAWNSVNAVRALLGYGANPLLASKRNDLATPLWLACTYHCSDALVAMLEHVKAEGLLDPDSILNGEWPLLKPVLDQGYYYRIGGTLGRIGRHGPSFKTAASNTLAALKNNGARMVFPNGTPIISQAILLRCVDIVDAVLALAPDTIDHVDVVRKQPPLHFAVQQDRPDITELLISRGANVDSRNFRSITALGNYANYFGGLEIPRILLRAGSRFEIPSNHSQTPFFGAVTRASFELATFILECTAPEDRHAMINNPAAWGLNFTISPPGTTILGYLLSDLHQNTLRLLGSLFRLLDTFDETLEFTVGPGEGLTGLHILAEFPRLQRIDRVVTAVAEEILSKCRGVEVDKRRDRDGRTALSLAIASYNYDLCSVLLAAGADPAVQDRSGTSGLEILRDRAAAARVSGTESQEERDVLQEILRLFERKGFSV